MSTVENRDNDQRFRAARIAAPVVLPGSPILVCMLL